ncbi:hypothetical protein Bca101_082024 [Brassica carinata]
MRLTPIESSTSLVPDCLSLNVLESLFYTLRAEALAVSRTCEEVKLVQVAAARIRSRLFHENGVFEPQDAFANGLIDCNW